MASRRRALETEGSLLSPSSSSPPSTSAAHAANFHKDFIRDLIVSERLHSICEVGGGRSPLFSVDEVNDLQLDYTLLDVADTELRNAPGGYNTVCADICQIGFGGDDGRYDLIFSIMLAEHVSSGAAMHRNVHRLLRPRGYAFHYFPTLFNPAFVVNKLLPERASFWLLRLLLRGRSRLKKFPARYSWCVGPSRRNVDRLERLGYEVVQYRAFYGTSYLSQVPILGKIERSFHRLAEQRRSRLFTSYAWLLLRKADAHLIVPH